MQRFYASPVARVASKAIGRLAETRLPEPILTAAVELYARALGIDRQDEPPGDPAYRCFGDFFARRIRPERRPLCRDAGAFLSPCDANLIARGDIDEGTRITVKGNRYSVDELCGGPALPLSGGGFCVLYLHPRDYHRVHAPCAASLTTVRHLPGHRFPVNGWAERRVPLLYQRNERVVFELALPSGRPLVLIMVAAFGVGHITTPFAVGGFPDRARTERVFSPPRPVEAGDELGAFRLGSTVVVLWGPGALTLDPLPVPSPMRFGARLGRRTDDEPVTTQEPPDGR